MKKITVLIPEDTYNILFNYCYGYKCGNITHKSLFFKDVINFAILDYCSGNTVPRDIFKGEEE